MELMRKICLSTMFLLWLSSFGISAETPCEKQTFTYKTVGECEIKADVYRLAGDDIRPALVYIHGGALVYGDRTVFGVPYVRPLLMGYLEAGFVVVAIDHRLAPETKLAGIVEDLQDAVRWIRETGPNAFKIDPNRIAVTGNSAGGFLTLITGFCVKPRPQVLVSYSGYGGISRLPNQREISKEDRISKVEAYAGIRSKPISGCPFQAAEARERERFLLYCRQNGIWGTEVVGHEPIDEPEKFARFFPIQHITKDFPPTILVHGDKDTDVSHQASVEMARELERNNVECELRIVPGEGHVIRSWEAYESVFRFLRKHIGS